MRRAATPPPRPPGRARLYSPLVGDAGVGIPKPPAAFIFILLPDARRLFFGLLVLSSSPVRSAAVNRGSARLLPVFLYGCLGVTSAPVCHSLLSVRMCDMKPQLAKPPPACDQTVRRGAACAPRREKH